MIKAVGPRPEVNPILAIHSRHFEDGSATTNASNRAGSPCSTAYDSLDDEDLLAAMAGFEIGPCASPNAQPESSCGERSTPNSSQHQPYYISEIPHLNLFVGQLPCKLLLFPYFTLFICLRISIRCRIPMSELMRGMEPNAAAHSPEAFWNSILKNIGGNTDVPQDSAKVWSAASNSFDGFVFKGKISFNTTMTPSQHVFNLEPKVIQSENSCRFERKFGSDRFLYLDCPSFKQKDIKPTRFTWKDMQQIEASWFDWLKKEHSFLGRTWQVIHMEPNDKGKKEELGMRVVMFATKGEGLPTIPRGEMLTWFLPLTENKDQGFCKAFARLDLGFSRTTPTLIFKPSQIRRVPDVRANGEPEDSQFNDTKLNWDERCMEAPVMNDGCSRISVGAAMKVWEEYKTRNKTSNPMPSVFQARIGGAKGLWMISGEPHSKDPRDLEIWIEINDQQLKFKPHPEDLDDQTYDPIRLRFEICGVSSGSAGKAATLHSTFISVLVDRHVPWDSITYIMTKQLDQERRQLIHMIQDNDTGELYRWTRKKISAPQHNGKIQWLASLPQELSRKILLLLECRLCPTESPYLANLIYRYVGQHLTWMEEKIRVPLGRSTYLYVVADPVGALKPGQIYVQFSEPFVDESTGITYRNLHGQDVLVTRHPCGRRSDIQRVQAVNCPALSHLVDVVVFPSRGQYPLAAKLQGGDYDGDQIWICWEDTLVEHFHNAPAPLNPPDPADYGIKKDTRKLCEVISLLEPSNSDTFFEEALKFRSQDSMLGMITNRTEELAYYQNGIHSETYEEFRDIHDLIIDAPKQAFIFTENDFQNLVKKSLKGMILSKPAYKQAMDERQNLKGSHQESRVRRQTNEYNPGNILDFLYFKIVLEHNITTEKAIADALPLEKNDTDPDLQNLCRKIHDEGPAMIRRELIELAKGFHQIIRKWDSGHSTNDNTFDASKKVVEACHKLFLSLLPISQNAALPEIRILQTHFYGPNQPTPWEMIRASAFYTTYPAKSKCVWAMAGKELATLKCGSGEESRLFCDSIAAILVTRRPRAPKAEHVMEEKKSFDEDATPPPIA